MKIAIRAGHNSLAVGARGIIKEEVEALKVKDAVIKYLLAAKHSVIDVTPGPMGTNDDLIAGVSKANKSDADLFVSIHFNKAYDAYKGPIGSEAWTIGPGRASDFAQRIVNSLATVGFKNRGVKHSKGLYELKHTRMSAIITEVCFVESEADVSLYKKTGFDTIGKKIAEGINGAEIVEDAPDDVIYRVKVDGVQIGAYRKPENVINQLNMHWGEVKRIEVERK